MNPTRLVVIFFLIFSSCASRSLAQSLATPKPANKSGGVIAGRVTVHGKGLASVVVVLRTAGFGGQNQGQSLPQARTDAEGNYRLTDVPMGSYYVTPVAPVYTEPGASRLTSANEAVVITGGETVDGIDFSLVRGGVITGKVADTESRPVIEQAVTLQNVDQTSPQGTPPIRAPGNFRTDDRGTYRIYGIPAGHYKVSVGAQQRFSAYSTITGQQAYKQTFYPDTTDVSQATVVEVTEGAEVSNVDIKVGGTVDQYSVTGHVIDRDTNAPVPNVGFALSVLAGGGDRQRGLMALPVISDSNGQFRVDNVPPGRYLISVAPQSGAGVSGQSAPFDVINQDVNGVEVRAVKGASLSGVVVMDGNQDPSILAELQQFQVQVFVLGNGGGGVGGAAITGAQSVPLNGDGSFQVTGLSAGTVRLSLMAQDSALQGAFKLLRTEVNGTQQPRGISVRSGDEITGVRLVAAYADGVIQGLVKIQNGTLSPGSPIFARLSLGGRGPSNLGAASVDARGRFLIQNVPPGSYTLKVTALASPPSRQRGQRSPSVSAEQQVVVTAGEVSSVSVILDLGQNPLPTPGP
jgi:hypothetical protein